MANLVTKVKDRIARHGWIQRSFGHPTVGYCIVGASQYQSWSMHLKDRFNLAVVEAIKETDPEFMKEARWYLPVIALNERLIFAWNDAEGRTKEEVFELLDRAEKIWERDHAE